MNNISDKIGLIELCFSGATQEKQFQTIFTGTLNDLIFTVKDQKKEIKELKDRIKTLEAQVKIMNAYK
jgi:cell division protein FtsB